MDLLYEICGDHRRFTDIMRYEQIAQKIVDVLKMDWFILAESFLEKPTALGVPMGTLLLFWHLMRRLDNIEKNKKD